MTKTTIIKGQGKKSERPSAKCLATKISLLGNYTNNWAKCVLAWLSLTIELDKNTCHPAETYMSSILLTPQLFRKFLFSN